MAFGYFGSTVAVASALGPLLGGLLIARSGRRTAGGIFLVNVPIGLVAMLAVTTDGAGARAAGRRPAPRAPRPGRRPACWGWPRSACCCRWSAWRAESRLPLLLLVVGPLLVASRRGSTGSVAAAGAPEQRN